MTSHRSSEALEEDRNRKFQHAERQTRDVSQNLEKSRRYLKDSEDPFENGNVGNHLRKEDEFFRLPDIYQRPVDELDTPRFPISMAKKEPLFAKIINPGVKIMRVDRDVDETIENYRYHLFSMTDFRSFNLYRLDSIKINFPNFHNFEIP